jgi:hypothetical protein
MDVLVLLIVLVFCAAAWGLIGLCERLMGDKV